MMSILLLTLLSALQAQPGMSRVSLLPVANVVLSYVQNVSAVELNAGSVLQVWLVPVLKSRVKVAAVKSPLAPVIGVLLAIDSDPVPGVTVNTSFQSCWSVVHRPVSGDGGQVSAVLPSSWKSRSWTANTVPAARNRLATRDAPAMLVSNRRPRRFLYTVRLNTIGTPSFRSPNRSLRSSFPVNR